MTDSRRELVERVIRQCHYKLGACINSVGHPDCSPRELVENLRQVRDELFQAYALSLREKQEGMVMVPREPTVVQVNAGVDADDLRTGFETVKHIYRAMIAVTPSEGGEEKT